MFIEIQDTRKVVGLRMVSRRGRRSRRDFRSEKAFRHGLYEDSPIAAFARAFAQVSVSLRSLFQEGVER